MVQCKLGVCNALSRLIDVHVKDAMIVVFIYMSLKRL